MKFVSLAVLALLGSTTAVKLVSKDDEADAALLADAEAAAGDVIAQEVGAEAAGSGDQAADIAALAAAEA